MKKKSSVKDRVFQIIMALLAIAFLASLFFVMKNANSISGGNDVNPEEVKVSNRTDKYTVPYNPTDYQKTLYEELAVIVNNTEDLENEDLSEYAAYVVKNFVADYFTWSNKRGSYDVGGLDFFFGPNHYNFSLNAREYFYYDLDILIRDYTADNLPSVKNIVIDSVKHVDEPFEVKTIMYNFNDGSSYDDYQYYDSYQVHATWEYELAEGSTYDYSPLPDHGDFRVVIRDGRLEVAYFHRQWDR